jgi:hypothetical protein
LTLLLLLEIFAGFRRGDTLEVAPMRYFAVLCFLTAVGAQAQTEAALKAFFEGKKVLPKQDLPAGKEGMDIYPKAQPMVDAKRYSTRLSRNGPSLLKGDSATISVVHVKEKLIEFQLSGSAYGILSDDTSSSPLSIIPKDSPIKQQHSLGNALINIWYPDKSLKTSIPSPEEIQRILTEYVEFGRGTSGQSPQISSTRSGASAKLKTGMTEGQVVNLLGIPRQSRQHMEGKEKVLTNTFQTAQESIEVDFIKTVVVNFRIRPR